MKNHNYDTVSEAIDDLIKRNYTVDFSFYNKKYDLMGIATNQQLSPLEFEIVEIYRFEGQSDPGDEMIVFAITSKKRI